MPAPRKYPDELRERSVRLVVEAMAEDPSLSLNAAVKRIGGRVGVVPDTLRGWAKQHRIDTGRSPGTTTSDAKRIKDLELEVHELKRANEILLAGRRVSSRGSSTRDCRGDRVNLPRTWEHHRARFGGVAPICRVLSQHGVRIAPRTYFAAKTRPPSQRSARDEQLVELITAVHADREKGRGVAGYRRVWHLLRRNGVQVARCTVERLMGQHGLQGVVRGRRFRTTIPDPALTAAARPADLVQRAFKAAAPNRLWCVGVTYVPTWSGMAFTAFVTDMFSRRIVGWRTHHRMPTELPLDALEMALWVRDQAGADVTGVIHHSDAGSQYVALRYTERLAGAGALASIGTVGDSYDNALAESVIGLYKAECVRPDGPFKTVDELELTTLSWVHLWNEQRLRGALGHIPPVEYEHALLSSERCRTATAVGTTDRALIPGRFIHQPLPVTARYTVFVELRPQHPPSVSVAVAWLFGLSLAPHANPMADSLPRRAVVFG